MTSKLPLSLLLFGLLVGGRLCAADPYQPPQDRSSWRITSGPQWRSVGRLSFGPAVSQGVGFYALLNSTVVSSLPPGVYDNGFVLPDNLNDGVNTSNFGWDASTLVNVYGGEGFDFELQKTETTTTTVTDPLTLLQPGGTSGALNGGGWFINLESPALWSSGGWELSLEVGYSWTGMRLSRLQPLFTGLMNQTITTTAIIDLYGGDDFGVTPGTAYTGNPASGPKIPIAPIEGDSFVLEEVKRAIVVDSDYNRSFGLDLHTLSLGPHLAYESPEGRFRASVSSGLALNLAYWNVSTVETLRQRGGGVLGAWGSHSSGVKFMPGWYLQTSLSAQLSERWYAMLAGRYDWAGTLHGGSGPTAFSVNLSGWTVMTGLTYVY